MESSAQLVKKIEKEIGLGAGLWFLWGITNAIGKWLDIDALKTIPKDGMDTLVFGGLLVSGFFVLECVKAILAGLRENASRLRD